MDYYLWTGCSDLRMRSPDLRTQIQILFLRSHFPTCLFSTNIWKPSGPYGITRLQMTIKGFVDL